MGAPAAGEPPGLGRLELSMPAPVPRAAAIAALGSARERWLGERETGAAPAGMARYALDLQLPVGDRSSSMTFRKAAWVDIGELVETPAAVGVEISWRAATMAPLFPVFSGRLTWEAGRVRLAGAYAPPGGAVGVLADRLLLNVAARGTGRWLLGRVVEAMEAAREG